MITLPISTLHTWSVNDEIRTISQEGMARIREQVRLGQHSTLLIMNDGTIVGGNRRFLAMQELGIPDAKCIVLSFNPTDDGKVIACLDGELQKDPVTKELVIFDNVDDGMMAYSLSHNDHPGVYSDGLINAIPNYNLNWDIFGAATREVDSIADWVDDVAPEDLEEELLSESLKEEETTEVEETKEEKKTVAQASEERLVECPDCACIFDPNKHLARKNAQEDIARDPAGL